MITITLVNKILALKEKELKQLLKGISIMIYTYHERIFNEEGVTREELIETVQGMDRDNLEKFLRVLLLEMVQGLDALEKEQLERTLNSLLEEGYNDKCSVCTTERSRRILH